MKLCKRKCLTFNILWLIKSMEIFAQYLLNSVLHVQIETTDLELLF